VALTIVKKRKKTHKRNLGVFLKEIFRKRNMRNILEYFVFKMECLKIIIFNKYVMELFRYHDISFLEHATFNIGNTPIGLYTFVMGQQHNKSPPQTNNLNKGYVTLCPHCIH
jgi:hypothetical protein